MEQGFHSFCEKTQSDSSSSLYSLSLTAFNYFDREAKDVEDSSFTYMYTSDVRKLTQLPDPLKQLYNVIKKVCQVAISNFCPDYVNLDILVCLFQGVTL